MVRLFSKEEAIKAFERLSATPAEAARLLVAGEDEARSIVKGIQERVKRQQKKWAPMDPEYGPPLPRLLAGLKWPWSKG